MKDGSIDAGLLLLTMILPRGVELSLPEIAYVCGCSPTIIKRLESSALRKLRVHADRLDEAVDRSHGNSQGHGYFVRV